MDKKNKKQEAANVEFGMEFGDINAVKHYDSQLAHSRSKKKKKSR
jgi:hypothetical protein